MHLITSMISVNEVEKVEVLEVELLYLVVVMSEKQKAKHELYYQLQLIMLMHVCIMKRRFVGNVGSFVIIVSSLMYQMMIMKYNLHFQFLLRKLILINFHSYIHYCVMKSPLEL